MEEYRDILSKLVSFKSISTNDNFIEDIEYIVNFLEKLFRQIGFSVEIIRGYSNPILYASYVVDESYKTALIYGHYDVQPASIEDGWDSEPFELIEKDNRFYARGVADNKGQFLIYLVTITNLIKTNNLKYNIKFIIEGNEESGSPNLGKFLEDYKDTLKSDFVLFSDGELTSGVPTIDIGFRGVLNLTLTIQTSHKDNHSGLYGGAVPNPVAIFADIVSKIYKNNILCLPNLKNSIEDIRSLSTTYGFDQTIKNIPFSEIEFLQNTGAKTRLNKDLLNFYFQVGYFTSAEVTGLVSGYTGEGYKNAIPGKLIAKINFRISPFHSVKEVLLSFEKFLQQSVPNYVDYKIDASNESVDPIIIEKNNEYIQKAVEDIRKTYNLNPSLKFSGAIVPICGLFQTNLGINKIISVGIANEDCNMHGANENLSVSSIANAIKFAELFLST